MAERQRLIRLRRYIDGERDTSNVTARSSLTRLKEYMSQRTNLSITGMNTQGIDELRSLTGTDAGTTNLGIFSGTTIADDSTIKTALQQLETAVESVPVAESAVVVRLAKNTPQTLQLAVDTKLTWQTVVTDSNNIFDAANNEIRPTSAGLYHVTIQLAFTNIPNNTVATTSILKNNAQLYFITDRASNTGQLMTTINAIVDCNGTTDTIAAQARGQNDITNNTRQTFFHVFKL